MRRARHQKGSLQRVKRKSGEAVWIFRWYEVQLDGAKRYRKAVIGSVQEYRTEADAQRAADALRFGNKRTNPATTIAGHQHGDVSRTLSTT